MRALLALFLDIALLRRGPQDVPASRLLAGLALAAYTLAGFGLLAVTMPLPTAAAQTVLDVVLLAAFMRLMLASPRLRSRFLQAFTACTGTGALFALVALPLAFWPHPASLDSTEALLPALLYLGLLGWSVVVMGHILRHALSITRGLGLVYAFVYLVVSVLAMIALFPQVS